MLQWLLCVKISRCSGLIAPFSANSGAVNNLAWGACMPGVRPLLAAAPGAVAEPSPLPRHIPGAPPGLRRPAFCTNSLVRVPQSCLAFLRAHFFLLLSSAEPLFIVCQTETHTSASFPSWLVQGRGGDSAIGRTPQLSARKHFQGLLITRGCFANHYFWPLFILLTFGLELLWSFVLGSAGVCLWSGNAPASPSLLSRKQGPCTSS